MGGVGSGRYYRWSSKTTVEEVRRVDVRYLRKRGFLKPGVSGTLSWTRGDEPNGFINFQSWQNELVLDFKFQEHGGEWQPLTQHIPIERTSCNYGGQREWLHCPRCDRRCEILYGAHARFLCRKCYQLPYRSQNEGPLDRIMSRQRKLEEMLWGDKRKRMSKARRERLVDEFEQIGELEAHLMMQKFGQWG